MIDSTNTSHLKFSTLFDFHCTILSDLSHFITQITPLVIKCSDKKGDDFSTPGGKDHTIFLYFIISIIDHLANCIKPTP